MRTPFGLADQAELDGVPVEPREEPHPLALDRLEAGAPVFGHVVGVGGVGQQRHVAEDVVEDVRLLEVVELLARADEGAGGEAA
jgi:hypothetical protein